MLFPRSCFNFTCLATSLPAESVGTSGSPETTDAGGPGGLDLFCETVDAGLLVHVACCAETERLCMCLCNCAAAGLSVVWLLASLFLQ